MIDKDKCWITCCHFYSKTMTHNCSCGEEPIFYSCKIIDKIKALEDERDELRRTLELEISVHLWTQDELKKLREIKEKAREVDKYIMNNKATQVCLDCYNSLNVDTKRTNPACKDCSFVYFKEALKGVD